MVLNACQIVRYRHYMIHPIDDIISCIDANDKRFLRRRRGMVMDTKMTNLEILNELSEFIAIRMKSFWDPVHGGNWVEHKAHIDYDLWFIQSGTVNIAIGEAEHTAEAGDVVFFYPGIPYRAATTESGCHFIYIHFDSLTLH